MNKQPKNVLSLHRQPMKVLREPRRRHLLRPRAVTIDGRRRSSIKTQKGHYRAADKVLNYHFTTSVNLLLFPEHPKKKRKKCKRKQRLMLQCVGGYRNLSEVLWVVLRKSDKQGLMSKRKKEENIVALFPLGFMFLADGQGEQNIC